MCTSRSQTALRMSLAHLELHQVFSFPEHIFPAELFGRAGEDPSYFLASCTFSTLVRSFLLVVDMYVRGMCRGSLVQYVVVFLSLPFVGFTALLLTLWNHVFNNTMSTTASIYVALRNQSRASVEQMFCSSIKKSICKQANCNPSSHVLWVVQESFCVFFICLW